jgi:hypothetical protein
MSSQEICKPILIGLLIAALLLPLPTQAQWTVFDPTIYGLQLKTKVEELNRWLETVNHTDVRKCGGAVN